MTTCFIRAAIVGAFAAAVMPYAGLAQTCGVASLFDLSQLVGCELGVIDGRITVTTDVPGEETLEIPVYAHIIAQE